MLAVITILLAFFSACIVLQIGVHSDSSKFIDLPNHRSLHQQATARIGGLLFVPICLLFAGCLFHVLLWPALFIKLAAAVGALWLLAVIDDARGLSAGLRFLIQLQIAGFAAWSCYQVAPSWWWWLWFAYALVGINFYNFMDGSDGIAALQGITGFAACGLFAWYLWPELQLHWLALLLVAVLSAFLTVNWQPAKMFMGDAGSTVLGFLAVCWAGLFYLQSPNWFWLAVVPFLPFWLDAGMTLLKRMGRGERFWQAHREHYYQRQILSGLSHRLIALHYALASLLCSIGAFIYLYVTV